MCALCVCLCTAISTKQHSTNGFATCWLREELEEASKRYMISIKSEQRTLPGLLEILFTVSTMKSKCVNQKIPQTVRAALALASVIVRSQEIRWSRRRSNSKKTARADRRWRNGNGKGKEQEGSLREWRMGEWKLLRTLQHVAATTQQQQQKQQLLLGSSGTLQLRPG